MQRATAFAPAAVGNVAVGFDILGFAVEPSPFVDGYYMVDLPGRRGPRPR